MNLEDLDRLSKSSLLALLKEKIMENRSSQSAYPSSQSGSTDSLAFGNHQIIQLIEDHNLKLARELHDDLSPHLTCLEMGIQSIRNHPRMNESDRNEKMDGLLKVVKNALIKTRTMTAGLNHSMVVELGLSEALSTWVALMDSVLPMKIVFVGASSGFTLRNKSAGVHVYRIAQESIQNAIKHSQAGLIEVFLDAQDENLVLIVQDNGKGKVEDGQLSGLGFGISNMRLRSQLLHGQLTFCENEPQGLKVRCEIPSVLSIH